MKNILLLVSALFITSSLYGGDLASALIDLHKQKTDTLLKLHERVMSDHERLLLSTELQKRERTMTEVQRRQYKSHPSHNRAEGKGKSKGKGHGREDAPGQKKKH